jgi:hypothetical protein
MHDATNETIVDTIHGAPVDPSETRLPPDSTCRNNAELAKQTRVAQKTYLPCVRLLMCKE